MILTAIVRYLLWLGVGDTAAANRRHYRMRSTWLPHLAGNTFVLLLPELVRCVDCLTGFGRRRQPAAAPWRAIWQAFALVVGHGPGYAAAVAPFALGYILSHPKRTIYHGRLAERRLLGLGLDALPHAATAFGLTALAGAGVTELARQTAATAPTYRLTRQARTLAPLVTLALLGLATAIWEFGEYRIHESELRQQGGRLDRINMMWSPRDMAADIAANLIGWLAATLLNRRAHR